MKSKVNQIVFIIIFLITAFQTVFSKDAQKNIYFGPCVELSTGYHNIGSRDLDDIEKSGYGKIDQTDLCILGGAGMSLFIPKITEISCVFIYTFNMSEYGYKWDIHNESVPLSLEVGDVRLEVKSLLPALGRISPYFGIGTTIEYDLLDEEGNGFTKGGGSLFYNFGIDINIDKELGGSQILGDVFSTGIRIGAVCHPSLTFNEFKIGGSTVPINATGNSMTYLVGLRLGFGLW